jgi:hypothetical protein
VQTPKSGFQICSECDGAKKCVGCGGSGFSKKEKSRKWHTKQGEV